MNNKGLTLIELLITLTIIGLLAAVAFPSYYSYMLEARRSDAQIALRENQLILINYMQSNDGVLPTSGQVTLLTTSENGFYDIAYDRVSDSRYNLVATPSTDSPQEDDTPCLTITLTSEMDDVYPMECR